MGKGGLEGIIQGLEDLELGKIRSEKLVYLLNDTTGLLKS